MKVLSLVFTVVVTVTSAAKVKREPWESNGFEGPSFFKSPSLPSSGYPSHPAPHYPPPPPPPQGPTHNCSIQEQVNSATVCVPTLGEPECSPVTLKGVQVAESEKCLSITRTVCAEGTEDVTVNICTIKYEQAPIQAEATLVEVSFNKECSTQMVTVCEPQSHYESQGYGYEKVQESYQHCKEIAQETCYNKPSLSLKPEQVTLMVPEPSQDCGPRTLSIPTVTCEDITEERCVQLPNIEEADIPAEQCTVGLGEPDCSSTDLVLPVQVCKELVFGRAHKPKPSPPSYDPYH